MDPAKLSDRLRAIVRTPGSTGPASRERVSRVDGAEGVLDCQVEPPEELLGGEWRRHDGASCFVVERRYPPGAACGREAVQTIALRLAESASESALVMGTPGSPPFVFFDLETTGLSGGAGTYAFLAGCGMFDAEGGFLTKQFLLLRPSDERQLLKGLGAELSRAGALVSFNGKSFDAPLIETRHLYHRLDWQGARLPHLDVLHPARRFWGDGEIFGKRQLGDTSSPCSLAALERSVLGARRKGDVPGFEIPARYFDFLRSGDARPLAGVLEHNRLDLLSLAGLAARLLDLLKKGPAAARHAREALALGRVYAHRGLESRAMEAYECAINFNREASIVHSGASVACGGVSMTRAALSTAHGGASMAHTGVSMTHTGVSMTHTGVSMTHTGVSMTHTGVSMTPIRIEALRSLGHLSRRAQRYNEAAEYWQRLIDVPGCPAHVLREATEALAVHHEHRAHDLCAAKAFALKSLAAVAAADEPRRRVHDQAVRHRLARIERKLGESQGSRLKFAEP